MKNVTIQGLGFYFLFHVFLSFTSLAQIGIGTTNPNPETLLHIESENGEHGILIPRVNLSDLRTLEPIPTGTASESLLVYNTNITTGKGFYYWNGTDQWIPVGDTRGIGDIKHTFSNTDHNGWYLLDGRLVNTLPVNAQSAATNLGFLTTLPNASDRVLKGKTASENLGEQKGTNIISIAQENLPNFNMSATTVNGGGHTHAYTDSVIVNATPASSNGGGTVQQYSSVVASRTTQTAGDHNHSVTLNSGGSGTAINTTPASIVTNIFIYLGK